MDNKLKEMNLKEFLIMYEKQLPQKPDESKIEEFDSELENWILYDISDIDNDEKNFFEFMKSIWYSLTQFFNLKGHENLISENQNTLVNKKINKNEQQNN